MVACSKHIIVHRDLKPANLMLGGIPHDTGTREMAAKEGVVKIADFGLSRSLAIMQHKNAVGESMHGSKRVRCAPPVPPAAAPPGRERGGGRLLCCVHAVWHSLKL